MSLPSLQSCYLPLTPHRNLPPTASLETASLRPQATQGSSLLLHLPLCSLTSARGSHLRLRTSPCPARTSLAPSPTLPSPPHLTSSRSSTALSRAFSAVPLVLILISFPPARELLKVESWPLPCISLWSCQDKPQERMRTGSVHFIKCQPSRCQFIYFQMCVCVEGAGDS